jgi:GNAT superfamily N-acetyltransferase
VDLDLDSDESEPIAMIRMATEADVDAIVAMGRRFLASTIYRDLIAESPEQMQRLAEMFVRDTDKVTLVAEQDRKIVGMLLVLVHTHFVSGERMAGEVAWWVEPEYRGCGLKLLKAAEQWAREQGAVKFSMVAPSEDVECLYQRLGFTKVETAYQRTL